MSEPKIKIIRVTFTEDYYIEMHDDKRSEINGWTIKEIIKDWFSKYHLSSYHATRDGHVIGGSRKFIETEILES